MVEELKGIRAKVLSLQATVKSIAKDKTNPHFHYTYASATNVNEKVGQELTRLGLIAQVETAVEDTLHTKNKDGVENAVVIAKTIITLVDAESGESMTFSSIGSGTDSSDKHAMKAATASLKYATLALVFGATTDDPEAVVNPGDVAAKAEPAKYIPPPTAAQNTAAVEKAVDNVRSMPARVEAPAAGASAAQQGPQDIGDGTFVVTVGVDKVYSKSPTGRKNGAGEPTFKPGTIVGMDLKKYDTFDDGLLNIARGAKGKNQMINIAYMVDEQYNRNKIVEDGVTIFGAAGEVPVSNESENY